MEKISFQKTIDVRYSVDVLVTGGGPAGCAAAIAASRQGANVMLIEGTSCFGGMGTAGLVPAFMDFSNHAHFLADGIGRLVLDKMLSLWGNAAYDPLAINSEILKRTYDELLIDAKVTLLLMTQMISVNADNGYVNEVICAGKNGIFAIKAKIYIDATGDGDLSVWAGAPFEKGDEKNRMMAGTLCSLWADIDWCRVQRFSDDRNIEAAYKDGVLTTFDRLLVGMWRVGETLGGGNIGHIFDVDGTDERSLTSALIQGRKQLVEYENYYKNYLSGYENMSLVSSGALMGIRETRRIIGDYVLSINDYEKRARFDDEIGRYAYPIDIHASDSSKESYDKMIRDNEYILYEPDESYGIPYRILTPKNLNNVLVAGRCVSCDRYVQSSIRVMPGCFITGQAAGIAASLAAESSSTTRAVDISALQKRLIEIGAFLPNLRSNKENCCL